MKTQQSEISPTDKRDMAEVFRDRLSLLISRDGLNLSQFSKSIGIDRSALSQFLTPGSTRLPRAETLCAISKTCGVSLDWLMGLIATDGTGSAAAETDTIPTLGIEPMVDQSGAMKLAQWHREALGYKIRYIPSTFPDILRTETISNFEFNKYSSVLKQARNQQTKDQLSYSRRPETDVEVCMPMQTLSLFAAGEGHWAGLSKQHRREQLQHMAELLDELYPTYRLFLFDERETYSASYTLFGPLRAVVYMGNMYIVINSVEHIRALTHHFDQLIRAAKVGPDRISQKITELMELV